MTRAWSFQEALGKTPIACADAPGFVVNRYFVPWLNEAVRLREEGLGNLATIEAAARKAFGIGMGPFELMNVTGVPIALHAARTLGRELGELYAPAILLEEQVEMPTGMTPAHKSRFEMIISVKEHEMHHRAQLMLIERMVGIVPHLTREMQARMAARAQAAAAARS